jgi:hypothetical protein
MPLNQMLRVLSWLLPSAVDSETMQSHQTAGRWLFRPAQRWYCCLICQRWVRGSSCRRLIPFAILSLSALASCNRSSIMSQGSIYSTPDSDSLRVRPIIPTASRVARAPVQVASVGTAAASENGWLNCSVSGLYWFSFPAVVAHNWPALSRYSAKAELSSRVSEFSGSYTNRLTAWVVRSIANSSSSNVPTQS